SVERQATISEQSRFRHELPDDIACRRCSFANHVFLPFGHHAIDLGVKMLFQSCLFLHGVESVSLTEKYLASEGRALVRFPGGEQRNQIFGATRDQCS